ncbi:hypothetical protein NBRC116593_15610 [Sulfitobacter pacificus]
MTDPLTQNAQGGDPAPRPIPDNPVPPTPTPGPDLPPGPNPTPAPKPIPPAAQRALAEAEERRKKAAELALPPELGGREGPEPVRYGDWEKKGLAVDF